MSVFKSVKEPNPEATKLSSHDDMHQGLAPGSMRIAPAWQVTKHGRRSERREGKRGACWGQHSTYKSLLACLAHSYLDDLWEL
jgi:hypothetical protein